MFHSFVHLFTAFSLFFHPHAAFHTTPPTFPMPREKHVIQAKGTITELGKTITLAASFPQEGGELHGTISGDCTGVITGKYTGDAQGKELEGNAEATCPVFFLTIHGAATFSGTVNTTDTQANLTYSASAEGHTQTGSLTLSLSE